MPSAIWGRRGALGILFLSLLLSPAAGALIIDHTTADIWQIPESAVVQAKATLHIAYGHTSHGSQLISGMGPSGGAELDAFMTANGATPNLYRWNSGGTGGALDLRDTPFSGASDLGSPDRYAWAQATRNYLALHPECNVIIWSWCGQASTVISDIDIYLNLMEGLIADFPNVQFVFMTGHLDGGGATGLLHLANEHIRQHCLAHNRILYDFADIESYDPDHLTYYMPLLCNDNCDYDSDGNGSRDRNWALDWQATHVQGVDWWPSGAAHSQHLNGNLKGYAAWWLWAALAGWDRCVPAPSDLTATANPPAGSVTLAWTDNSTITNEDSFVIQRRVNSGAWDDDYASVAADVTTFVDTGLALGTYAYRVVAHRDDGGSGQPCDSAPSNVASAVISHSAPAAPINLASSLDGYDVTLSWSDQSDNEENFVLERAVDAGSFGLLATLPANTTTHLDAGLAPDHTYRYRVMARNNFGDSGYSNETSQYVAAETFSLVLKQSVGGYDGCTDAYLDSQYPTYNWGGDQWNDVENSPKCNFAIRFELPAEVQGQAIVEARLGFYCWSLSNWQSGQYLDLYRLTEEWTEGTADGAYQAGCASWATRSGDGGGDLPWTTPGGTHDPEPIDRSLIPSEAYYPEFDVTALVQEWANGTLENFGAILVNDSVTRTGIKASEYSEYGRPYLEITYTHPGPVGEPDLPAGRLRLDPGQPNPATSATTFRFRLANAEAAELSAFTIDGRHVATIWNGVGDGGEHEARWLRSDDLGAPVPAGVYLVRLRSSRSEQSVKIVLR